MGLKQMVYLPFVFWFLFLSVFCDSSQPPDSFYTSVLLGKNHKPAEDEQCSQPLFFKCDSGQCIEARLRCDSKNDCDDGSDETSDCKGCKPNMFRCALSKRCLPQGWECDGEFDCGFSHDMEPDMSDEHPELCTSKTGARNTTCPPNQAQCAFGFECKPIKAFCDGNGDCLDNSDEWDFCENNSQCDRKQCDHGCRMTLQGPACFCPDGQQPDKNKCVDANECLDDTSCDQICTNTPGSFKCSCVSGYVLEGSKTCKAINVPPKEAASLLLSTTSRIIRVDMKGVPWPGNSKLQVFNTKAMEVMHRNRTLCYIYNHYPWAQFACADIDNMTNQWVVPTPDINMTYEFTSHLALDWISGNWYIVDNEREVIVLCNGTLSVCTIVLEVDLSKPKGMALDPTKGYMFVTKSGQSPPMLLRAHLDGQNRTNLVETKIVYPCGIALDFPNQHVYWADLYLDYVERVNYDGSNRKTIVKGIPGQRMHAITLLENNLYITSWANKTVLQLSKYNTIEQKEIVTNVSYPQNLRIFHRQRQPDVPHPCRQMNGGCEHICIPMWKNGLAIKQCICKPGYLLKSNGRCELASDKTFLIYGKRKVEIITSLSINTKPAAPAMIPIENVVPGAIDFDVKTQHIYFSDVIRYVIERQALNGTGRELVIDKDVHNCEGLAVDWMSRNLYWTNEGLSRIYVAKLANVTQRKILIHDFNFHPRSLTLDPAKGMMYWSEWGSIRDQGGKIERAWMDGTHREVFITDQLHWPNGLTIDYKENMLYWCDAYYNVIERATLDGKNRVRLASLGKVAHPYGVAYFNNTIYWTETQNGTINVLHLANKSVHTLYKDGPPLLDVKVYDSQAQTGENGCSNNNGGCSQLCLPTPNATVCACMEAYEDKSGKCIKIENYKEPSRCEPEHFQCVKNLRCIWQRYVCDGDDDCGDGSDEDSKPGGVCEHMTCTKEQFDCGNNQCITRHWVCDGDRDCLNGNDETPEMCRHYCPSHQFTCNVTGRCIPIAWTCDSEYDCGENDTSDEHNDCFLTRTCPPTEFRCDNNRCISYEYYCDGDNDCLDNSDEKQCMEHPCDRTREKYCPATGKCIPIDKKCDGDDDCPDGTDSCATSIEFSSKPTKSPKYKEKDQFTCDEHSFQCAKYMCIPMPFRCDGVVDCSNGADEKDCDSKTMKNVTIPSIVMNVTLECEHPNRTCDNGTKCISVSALCDDKPDCTDGSDEGFRCSEHLCDHSLDCSHYCHNAPEGMVCYCPSHLHLQTDKMTCLNTHPCDTWGTCSQQCLPKKSRHVCSCFKGYRLQDDKFTCKSEDEVTPYVIFSNRHELRGVDLKTFHVKALISSLKNTIALDFYHKNNTNMVFWTDVIDDKIYRGTLIGGSLSNIEVVVQTGLATAEGLAVDWIGENLYWVESNLDQIEVARLNGSYRRTLVAGEMESPRAIALDPRFGLLFWTDWDANAPRIERCSMAGQARSVVVRVDKLTDGAWPNGLTLDYALKRIYWIDARSDSIHTTTYDGEDHHEIIRGHEMLSHPFAIAVFESYVYWTDWRTNSVIRANKWTGGHISVIQRTLTQPFDIQILHPSRQPRDVENPCGTNNGGCSHLCLLNGNNTYKCDCPHVMRLAENQRTCVVNERVLLFSRANEIRGVDLSQPYYHTIPTISLPQVVAPSQLDFVARASMLYWTDGQVNEVKRTGLTSGPTHTIIDTGIEHPTGLAIDWVSQLMFVSSSGSAYNHISACNLDGEYSTIIISGDELYKVTSLAVDPTRGKLYWTHTTASEEVTNKEPFYIIESAAMDGSERKILVKEQCSREHNGLQSLSMDLDAWRLYWVDSHNSLVQYYDFTADKVHTIKLHEDAAPTAAVVYMGELYYADQNDQAIHVCNKTTGDNDVVLRNNTSNVLSLKIYDPAIQIGNNSCWANKGGCQHLCLPLSATQHKCQCATGYKTDETDATRCVGIEKFLFYSINWEIRGIPLDGNNDTQMLGPISKVSMASSIDFDADEDFIYWADSDRGTITRIKRDGTERKVVVEQYEVMENVPVDWLTGLAVDWAAKNMYWSDPKRNVMEVARLNGSSRYVVVSDDIEKPTGICVDPGNGYLFWSANGRIERARLDGSNRTLLLNQSSSVTDITLEYETQTVYWCDSVANTIEKISYDGEDRSTMLAHDLENPTAVAVFEGILYWIDTTHLQGSIKAAPVTNLSSYTVLLQNIGDSLKDIQVFSKRKQLGTNPCAENNGGCAELCLFNGTHPVCACPHGKVAADGKSCEEYDAFIMYSRVVRLDSIHMWDASELNAPYASIQDKELMRNAIGLTFDYKRSRIFYSDIQRGSINMVHFNGSGHAVVVDNQGSVEGLAYEQIDNLLYWTCNNDATISRINLTEYHNNNSAIVSIVQLEPHDKPRGIAVDSCKSRIYWTNWNSHHPSIQRAYLTGFGYQSIITTDIRMPNALTLDHQAQKLYWADARLDKIERCEYDGSNRVVVSKGILEHPFDIAVYGNYLYWTDWVLHAVLRVNKYTGEELVWLRRNVPRPMGIVAVANDTDDCFSNPCSVLNGGCEDVCTLDSYGKVVCSCFTGRILADDQKRCVSKKSACAGDSFRCSDGGCVPFQLTCDGVPHCADSTDEDPGYCGYRQCPPFYFQCVNKRCITVNLTCNYVDNCGDNSDELNCTCSDETQFKCKNGQCILRMFKCDHDPDCSDASDEVNCGDNFCQQNKLHQCAHTTACIHPDWYCDGENDCWDNSDEENCTKPIETSTETTQVCPANKFQCANGRCIFAEWRCDHDDDCKDGGADGVSSDERGCKSQCRTDQFMCQNGECIPVSWQCDGQPDCADGSDESTHCQHRKCNPWEFRCNNTGRCIPWSWVCDGEDDCTDSADELQQQGCTSICQPDQFLCLNGHCIAKQYYCDKDNDCGDNSDEPATCDHMPHKCLPIEFACANGKCILEIFKCNGLNDCGDNSDEEKAMCAAHKATGIDSCKEQSMFECLNGVCLNETLLCNGHNDCGDFSDEKKCNINECEGFYTVCAHTCIDKPIGYECQCNKGFRVSTKDKHICEDVDECLDRPCSQLCRNTHGSYVCSCVDGYILRPDGHTCKLDSEVEAKLIFANRYYIRELDLSGHINLLTHNLANAVGLDFDWKEKCLYWSNVMALGSSIKRACNVHPSASNQSHQVLHSATLQNPDGLAVDWIGRNLYWCDKGLDTIEVSALDGRFRKVLLHDGLDEPRAIVLHPHQGYMFWSDWGDNVHIGKAGMDGSSPRVIVNDSLGWPNALTISYETSELFWADAREDYIAVADLDGRNMKFVARRSENPSLRLHHVFAIAVFEDFIYWTDWETKSVERCHKYRGDNCSTLARTIHRPMDIQVYHPSRQLPLPDNKCEKSNCSTLCLLTPEPPGYKCACPENYVLGEDGMSCVANCTSAHFVCANTYKCIPFWWKCDTQDDCDDRSDEPEHCREFHCTPGQFQCNNNKCIHPSQLCNGEDDCQDQSDEQDCNQYNCLSTQFKCKGNGTISDRCIPSNKRCNDYKDCPFGEDEEKCPPPSCPPSQHLCDNGKCIPAVWVCDGDNDCKDFSDETQDCANRTCPPDHFRCLSGRCIPNTWKCDGDPDCPREEDEPPTCSSPEHHSCEPTYFQCDNKKCIPGRWQCDYDNDCGDGSDERNCTMRECSESEFRCRSGRCVQGKQHCDGEYNCEDHSDEEDCQGVTKCGKNEFQCHEPAHCIFIDWRCDGDQDCADGSDELNCSDTCPENRFKCGNGQCVPEQWRCDGRADCDDGSDEEEALCAKLACPPDRLRCRNHRCVPRHAVCDGKDQCGDNTDEQPETCKLFGVCAPHQFRCANGHCIAPNMHCDGSDDCGDNSDELNCSTFPCQWDSCSQICVERKNATFGCKCAWGYAHIVSTKNSTCQARGSPATLLIALDAELRLLSPYKAGASSLNNLMGKETLAMAPGYKLESVDVAWDARAPLAFWCDHHNKRIQKLSIHLQNGGVTRTARDADTVITVVEGLNEPSGIAVDWVTRRLYIVDTGAPSILVSTFDGRSIVTLVDKNLQQPHDIVVDPGTRRMAWTDWGFTVRIEAAYMDGTGRAILVEDDVLWPTGLAVDHPVGRLYWADPKQHVIESILLDGTDRHVIKRFAEDKPYKLEVFEDTVYLTTYHTHNIMHMNKFGRDNGTYLVQGLTRLTEILILHESKQDKNIQHPCKDSPCKPSALCLMGAHGKSCKCLDGFTATSSGTETECKTDKETTASPPCNLNCYNGTCTMTANGPRCVCNASYSGPQCEQDRCAQFCRNKGMCYVDLLSTNTHEPPLKCNCPSHWTGERCETPVYMCEDRCYNNGTCYTPKPDVPQCNCKPGYTGARCENCISLTCHNGGVCSEDASGNPVCTCPQGYSGHSCHLSECDGYCSNKGTCTLTSTGPQCACPPGFSGKKCDHSNCHNICQNGGICKANSKQVVCECPPLFSGRRCEVDLCKEEPKPAECHEHCTRNMCQNNGTCVVLNEQQVCKCASTWGGAVCDIYIGHQSPCAGYCRNGGVCEVASASAQPQCHCTPGWSDARCATPTPCLDRCLNSATCSITDGLPVCTCTADYEGARCEKAVVRAAQSSVDSDSKTTSSSDGGGSVLTGLLIFFGLLIVLLAAVLVGYLTLKRRRAGKPFTHERLDDNNLEISNPMYMTGDVEDDGDPLERSFTLDPDKGNNFVNPVYDTMYNNSAVGNHSKSEEKAVLLDHVNEETVTPGTDEL